MATLRKLLISVLAIACLTGVLLIALFYVEPRIPLGNLTGVFSSVVSSITGSEQRIEGNIYLTPGKWFTLEVSNTELVLTDQSKRSVKAFVGEAKVSINLKSLLAKRVLVDEFTVRNVQANLHVSDQGVEQLEEAAIYQEPLSSFPGSVDISKIEMENIALTLNNKKSTPWSATIRQIRGNLNTQGPSKLDLDLVVLDKELQASFASTPMKKQIDGQLRSSFNSTISHMSSLATLQGEFAVGERQPYILGELSLKGKDFDDLARLFGQQGSREINFDIQGSFLWEKERVRAHVSKFTPIAEQLELTFTANPSALSAAQMNLAIKSDHLDLDKCKALISPSTKDGSQKKKIAKNKFNRDDILIPSHLPLDNLQIDLALSNLVAGGRTFEDVHLSAEVKRSGIDNANFAVKIFKHRFSGEMSMALDQSTPEIWAHLATPSIDLGQLFTELQLGVQPMQFKVSEVSADFATKGRALGDLWDNLKVVLNSASGHLLYQAPKTEVPLPIAIHQLHLSATPGDAIHLSFDGNLLDTPIDISIELEDKRNTIFMLDGKAYFKAVINAAKTQWQLTGNIPLPFRGEGLKLESTITGDSFSDLNDLIGVQFPEIGPYDISGVVSVVPQGYQLNSLDVEIGETHLTGAVLIDSIAATPSLHANFESPYIQIDDLRAAWLSDASTIENVDTSPPIEESPEDEDIPFITDQEVLDSYDAKVQIRLDKVMSGKDFLGSGSLNIDQFNGRLRIDPLQINLPRGGVNLNLLLEPSGTNRHYAMELRIDELDYGVIGRYFKPNSNIKGTLSFNTFIDSISPHHREIMKHGSGFIDVLIIPEKIRSGVIDLWAVNLLSYLVPVMNPDKESKVNCAAGRFNIENGVLKNEALLGDTSRIQVKGKVAANFHNNQIEAFLRPIPKRPQFYSLATPITIKGNFSDFKLGVARGGVLGTLIRFATSYIVVPLQWIILNKVPENGIDDCIELFQGRESTEDPLER